MWQRKIKEIVLYILEKMNNLFYYSKKKRINKIYKRTNSKKLHFKYN